MLEKKSKLVEIFSQCSLSKLMSSTRKLFWVHKMKPLVEPVSAICVIIIWVQYFYVFFKVILSFIWVKKKHLLNLWQIVLFTTAWGHLISTTLQPWHLQYIMSFGDVVMKLVLFIYIYVHLAAILSFCVYRLLWHKTFLNSFLHFQYPT